jgi:hypothetical protein
VIWAKDDDGAIRGFVLEKGAKVRATTDSSIRP